MSSTQIKGVFTAPDGTPAPGVEIYIICHRSSLVTLKDMEIRVKTGLHGEYDFLLSPGGYTVTVTYPKKRPVVVGRINIESDSPTGTLNEYLIYGDEFYSDQVAFNKVRRHSDDALIAASLARVNQEHTTESRAAAERVRDEVQRLQNATQQNAQAAGENAEAVAQATAAAAEARKKAEAAAAQSTGAVQAGFETLAQPDGLKKVGRCASIAALRQLEPDTPHQKIDVVSYHGGSGAGGGEFVYDEDDTTTVDDGGFCIVTAGGARWKRNITDLNLVNVTHFGAVNDVDCAPAVMAMFNWSQNVAPTLGVRFPPGPFIVSEFDISDRYISMFRLTGSPVSMGYFATTTLTSDRGDGFMFQVQARMTEIANLVINGEYDKQPNNKGFFKNVCTGGQYYRGSCLRWLQMGGNALNLLDTLDTRIDQFYSSHSYDELIVSGWSGREAGNWDHSTAIELSNFNIQYAYKNAFNLPRATQSLIRNGWIEHSEYPGNLSNGHWIIDGLSIESSTHPLDLTYARVVMTNLNLQSGGSLEFNTPGTVEWLSAYERGYTEIQPHGIRTTGSINYSHITSEHRLSNSTSGHQWFQLGSFSLPSDGDTVTIRIIGGLGYNANGLSYQVGSSRHGNGAATLRLQRKSGSNNTQIMWEGEGNCPVSEIKYVSAYPDSITVYIRLGPWVRVASPLVETTAVDRYAAGKCFFWRYSGAKLTPEEVDALEGVKTALAQACWSAGGKGIVIASDGHIALDTVDVVDNALRIVVNNALYEIALKPVTSSPEIEP